MNANQLLSLCDRVAETPDAIARLRRFVRELAVRGRLVEQNPADEPAAQLLKRLAAGKIALKRETNDARIKPAPDVRLQDYPAVLPDQWCVQSFENLFLFIDYRGNTPPKTNSGIPLITAKNVRMGMLNREPREYISQKTFEGWMTRGFPRINDLFFTTEAPLANVCLNDIAEPFALAQRIICLQPYAAINTRYIMLALMSDVMQGLIDANATGMTAKGIKAAKLKPLPIPIPPLAEQHRIVAKVDELMALCDQLEAARTTREATRDRLTTASLTRLTAPDTDAETFRSHARFALDAFPALTSRPDQIKTLRQTILNLAVQGRFNTFDDSADDESDLEELRKLRLAECLNSSERAKVSLEFERTLCEWRESTNAPRFVRTLCACHFITKGTTPAPSDLAPHGEIPFLKVYNIVNNKLAFSYRPTFIAKAIHTGPLARSIVKPGDVIMNIVGPPLGKVALVTNEYDEWNINQALAYFRPLQLFSNRFMALVLTAPVTIRDVLKETRGTVGQDNLSLEQVRSLRIPFISLNEQHRIVAKVDALMALCDQLEASLTTADATRRRLLEALLSEALEPAADALEAAE